MITIALAAALLAQESPVAFRKQVLSERYLTDGVGAGDFNRDGKTDVVAGPLWYEGPGFTVAHEISPVVDFPLEPSPTDCMFSYVADFNRDGWPDVLRLGRVHLHPAHWFENPQGKPGHWKKHFVFERVFGESPPFVDVDGDGAPELVCHWEKRWGLLKPDRADPAKPWVFSPITEPGEFHHFYHGTGTGDVDGDGKPDLLLNEGWWTQRSDGPWTPNPFKYGTKGGAQMFATDVDGDGDADVVTALDAHGWGLAWFEQVRDGGKIDFRRHDILGDRAEEAKYGAAFSQPHALAMADFDGDGLLDLVVGKRRWAHGPKGDVEPMADPVVYWFRLVREGPGKARYVPHRIDDRSGVGVQIAAVDVTGDGVPDVLTTSKLGAFLFRAERKPR
jgi:hypothetical protein